MTWVLIIFILSKPLAINDLRTENDCQNLGYEITQTLQHDEITKNSKYYCFLYYKHK